MHKLREKRGMALLLVLTTVVIITVLIVELNYNARISMTIASNYKDEVRAYYLARSSVNVALLRLAIVKKMRDFNMNGIKIPSAALEVVWSFPFIFPPPAELLALGGIGEGEGEESLDLGTKEMLSDIKKKTNISSVGSFEHTISGVDSKINLNIIASSEESAQKFKEQMKNHYTSKMESDESFAHRYPVEDFDALLNDIIDWIDMDKESRNGGDENSYYENQQPPYKARNAPMPSINELYMVKGVNDELFDFFSSLVTVFSSGSINVNDASPIMWKTIDNRLTDEEIKLISEKIQKEGPFSDEKELKSWIGQNTTITATNFNPLNFPLSFEERNFKIEARGISGKVIKKVICYVSETYSEIMMSGEKKAEQTQEGQGSQSEGQSASVAQTSILPQSVKPNIVFWEID